MKAIVIDSVTEIKISDLKGEEIIAYSSRGNHICILSCVFKTKTTGQEMFGFKNLAYTKSKPVYVSDTMYGAIHTATLSGRKLFAFDNYDEFIEAIKEGAI